MENSYNVPSERYGYTHRFVSVHGDGNPYYFVPEKGWMPLYLTFNRDKSIHFVDTEGGPCVGPGFSTDEVIVTNMERVGDEVIFTLKEKTKE